MAVCEDGQTYALTDKRLPHPSIVWFRGDEIVVGAAAKAQYHSYVNEPGNVFVKSVKGLLGTDKVIPVFGRQLSPSAVAGYIFEHLARQARAEGLGVRECVVTIPIHFGGSQRKALREAAAQAGLHIKTFVHEPFAAFVGYIKARTDLTLLPNLRRVLVCDWGGGTLDVTLIRVDDRDLFEVSTLGLEGIAGDKFDSLLTDLLVRRFADENHLNPAQLGISPRAWDRLAAQAERAKIRLSTSDHAQVTVEGICRKRGSVLHLDQPVTRADFESLIVDDVDRALKSIDDALRVAGINPGALDLVLMIGGTSLIPLIDGEMRSRFGSRVCTVSNAPTVIAEGAAIVAHNDWQPCFANPIKLRLSDDSLYTVFVEKSQLHRETARKEMTLFCTDQRDGEARVVTIEGAGFVGRTDKVKSILSIPVNASVNRRWVEQVYVKYFVDDDLVLNVCGHGSIEQKVVTDQIHDLCMGLRTM